MNRNYLLIFTGCVLLAWRCVFASPSQETPDRNCYQSYRNPSKITCEEPIIAIVANPRNFEGKNVTSTGYLRRVNDALVMFPSKDIYTFSGGVGGIELLGASSKITALLDNKDECSQAVTVIADFTAKTRGTVRGVVGVFYGDISAFVEKMPGEPPALPKKDSGFKAKE